MTECTHPHTPEAARCRACNGQFIKEQAAIDRADDDRELLRLRDEEHLSDARLAVRLNVTRQSVHTKIAAARRRERVRQEMLAPVA